MSWSWPRRQANRARFLIVLRLACDRTIARGQAGRHGVYDQEPPLLRLSPGQYHQHRGRPLLAADPPQPPHPVAGFLLLLCAWPAPLAALAAVAGRRWSVEENFQAAKGLTGLDQQQVRNWASWHRWVTLVMLAAAFLTITAAEQAPQPQGQIPLTRNEISRLLATVTPSPPSPARPPGRLASPPGAATTSTASRSATTSAKQPKAYEDHDLQLEY